MNHIEIVDLVDCNPSQTDLHGAQTALDTSFTGRRDAYDNECNDERDCMILDDRTWINKANRWTGWSRSLIPDAIDKENAGPGARAEEEVDEDGVSTEPPDDADQPTGTEQHTSALTYWIPERYVRKKFWTYEPYEGPNRERVEILYCKTRIECENAAKRFLKEPVIGFDMEWKPQKRRNAIQDNISVIQIASESTIALFHIALIKGRTASDVLAPSLRKLIESPQYTKCGVAVNSADGNRLRRWMKLEPRGMFELSYFHRVVWHCDSDRSQVKKRLLSLSTLCQIWLGGPLHKGSVRTSNWTRPLTEEQIRYAASDAYAGVRLYYAIDARRMKKPRPPPIPAHTELDLPLLIEDLDLAQPLLESPDKSPTRANEQKQVPQVGGKITAVSPIRADFWVPDLAIDTDGTSPVELVKPATSDPSAAQAAIEQSTSLPALQEAQEPVRQITVAHVNSQPSTSPLKQAAEPSIPAQDPTSRRLYNALCAKRRQVALRTGVDEKMIISDPALRGLAELQPRTQIELAAVPGGVAFGRHCQFDVVAFVQKHAPLLRT